jgi:drug/metabolite transporter (DMT)-like permease
MKPIWYFVGLILFSIGLVLIAMGIVHLVDPPPPEEQTVLFETHPNIWWGGLMAIFGAVFALTTKNKTVE